MEISFNVKLQNTFICSIPNQNNGTTKNDCNILFECFNYNPFCNYIKCLRSYDGEFALCHCGEETPTWEWVWQNGRLNSTYHLSDGNTTVCFDLSESLTSDNVYFIKTNRHYYWEIKILSVITENDFLIGVGASLEKSQMQGATSVATDFVGFSYRGRAHGCNPLTFKLKCQWCNQNRQYGTKFGLGSLVGVQVFSL